MRNTDTAVKTDSSFPNLFTGLTCELFAKVILQVVKKSRFFNYSPLSLCPLPLRGNDETVSPEGGKGIRCAPVVSCPLRGKDV